ncbi:MAG: InlB B-repeat-containing protein [Clostridia bacterium]|nr:InlB B-repeat-containing protein [Clostridia bacterium]
MKKRISLVSCLMAALLSCSVLFGGCTDKDDTSSTPTEYTIQYTDDAGLHSLSVTSGSVYSLEVLPEKYGYEFLGLFDAKTGGTQYIDETGSSLSAFTDNKNMVLFPQFKAKEYTLILDYQGATVTGSRSMTVSYDSAISELPMNLSLENKEFMGWYTEPNAQGTQIADEYGVLPANNKVTETIFDLSGTDNTIYLYAGFENVKYTVTFYFEDNNNPEEIKVEHGTDIKDVVPETRVNGNAVLTWSKIKNDTNKEYIFTGKVTDDLVLYATEYAPVIDFDENGGEEVIPVVARASSSISLPTPIRENYKFIEWQDENGNTYTSTTMPTKSVTLKAVWQAKLVFDENGGTEVTDISKAVGESITLPTPEKEGFIFAGWYTSEKEKYESKTMPATGVVLKAGWYAVKEEKIVVVKDSNDYDDWASSGYRTDTKAVGPKADWRKTIDLSTKIPENGAKLSFTVHWDMKTEYSAAYFEGGIYFYDGSVVSEANYLTKSIHTVDMNTWKTFTFSTDIELRSNILYICYYARRTDGKSSRLYYKNMWIELTYPDTTTLYL